MYELEKIRWKSHHFGTCLVRHKDKLVYVNIPKCASEWAKHIFGGERHNFIDTPLPDDYRYIVILRNPNTRLVSGICEWLKRYTNIDAGNPILDNPDVISLITGTGGAHDEHTELQSRFIQGIPLEKIIFFKCDQHLKTNLEHWMMENNVKIYIQINQRHQTKSTWKDRMISLEKLINHKGSLKKRVTEQLKVDNELYDSVQYYTKGEE